MFESLSPEEAALRLRNTGRTLILLHARPDADTVGSGFALKIMLGELFGAQAYCVCADELPERLRFLSWRQSSILLSSLPADFAPDTVISVDVASPSQLGALLDAFGGRIDLMLDHHRSGTPFADFCVTPELSAAGELVFELWTRLCGGGCDIPEDPEIRREFFSRIYAGISSDTGCFKYSNVTPETHRRAAVLLSGGIDTGEINRLLFDSKSPKVITAEKLALENLRYFCDGLISVIPFTCAMKTENGLLEEHIETVVDIARTIEGVSVGVALKQSDADPRVFRVSMRSNRSVNVADIAMRHGGGGHVKAAGCTITADSVDAAVDIIVSDLMPAVRDGDAPGAPT